MARGRAGHLVVLGARADAELPRFAAVGTRTRHGGGVFIMDVLRVVLARVSGAVSAERADAVRRRAWVGSFPWIRRETGICGSGIYIISQEDC